MFNYMYMTACTLKTGDLDKHVVFVYVQRSEQE